MTQNQLILESLMFLKDRTLSFMSRKEDIRLCYSLGSFFSSLLYSNKISDEQRDTFSRWYRDPSDFLKDSGLLAEFYELGGTVNPAGYWEHRYDLNQAKLIAIENTIKSLTKHNHG